ncbi:hypothetical protein ACIA8K_24555 [Catenuloplanes sp. NPDC051500]|uniref:hypothetical protein n=1 Tax=Catenuloplanes sp. NPDC051500 TaxID=3363959 RepID=UPI00379A9BEB
MVQAGLKDIRFESIPLVFTDLTESYSIMPLSRDLLVKGLGDSPYVDSVDPWLDDLHRAAADNTFLVTLTMWVVTGTR